MALEAKEVLKAFGLPEDTDSVEKAVEGHRKKYVLISEAHEQSSPVYAKIYGAVSGELAQEAKKLFDLSKEDMEEDGDKRPLRDVMKRAKEKVGAKIKELEEAAGKNNDEKLKSLLDENEKLKGRNKQYETDLKKIGEEKDQLATSFSQKLKEHKVSSQRKDIAGRLPYSDAKKDDEIWKTGFDNYINSKYNFDLDENEKLSVTDKQGQKVPHPGKTGIYLSAEEIYDMELDKQGGKKKNGLPGGQRVPNGNDYKDFNRQPDPNQQPQKRGVHPRAAANAEAAREAAKPQ